MIRQKISIRLNAGKLVRYSVEEYAGEQERTGDEDVLVWCPDKLQCLLGQQCHVFINGIFGDVLVGAVVKCNKNV